MKSKYPIGILGATGMVGQRYIQLLADHPWFEIAWLAASDRSSGKPYGEAAKWRLDTALPERIAKMTVSAAEPDDAPKIIFASVDTAIAREMEPKFAAAGCAVISNSSAFRMAPNVPLVLPEANAGHLQMIEEQPSRKESGGYIVTNSNCSAMGLVLALKPIEERFGIEQIFVTTMQAISGAGYPGVASMDILDNVIPFIGSEEEKMETETLKLLGKLEDHAVTPLNAKMTAHCNRVAVVDGHTECVSIKLGKKLGREVRREDILAAWEEFRPLAGLGLPSAPDQPIEWTEQNDRPQPRLDRNRGKGMTVTVGRLRPCNVLDWKFVLLSHNTVRGAAGATILNAEMLASLGKLEPAPVAAANDGKQKMNLVVMKFGGTSVEDPAAIGRTAAIVAGRVASGKSPVVVVSAMAKVTDQLLRAAAAAAEGDRTGALAISSRLRARHRDTACTLVKDATTIAGLIQEIDQKLDALDEVLRGVSAILELTPRISDLIVSHGERLSSRIVTAAFRERGVSAEHVDAREIIVTDSEFQKAAPIDDVVEKRAPEKLMPLIAAGIVPVMGGFIASNEAGLTTTLGRGGSDYTGALVGGALNAETIEIWTDVDGIMTADPRVCSDALRVRVISFEEAAELAYFGAKVLHPATILPAVKKNIPVLVLNSRNPGCEGTRIISVAPHCNSPFKSIAVKRKLSIIDIVASRMLMTHGYLSKMFAVFDKHKCPVDMVSTSEVSISLTVDSNASLPQIAADLSKMADVKYEGRKALVCMVGEDIRGQNGIAAQVFNAIRHVNVRMISQGASEINMSFMIEEDDADEAVRSLHAAFFKEPDPAIFDVEARKQLLASSS